MKELERGSFSEGAGTARRQPDHGSNNRTRRNIGSAARAMKPVNCTNIQPQTIHRRTLPWFNYPYSDTVRFCWLSLHGPVYSEVGHQPQYPFFVCSNMQPTEDVVEIVSNHVRAFVANSLSDDNWIRCLICETSIPARVKAPESRWARRLCRLISRLFVIRNYFQPSAFIKNTWCGFNLILMSWEVCSVKLLHPQPITLSTS